MGGDRLARLPELNGEELAELHDAVEARLMAIEELLSVSTAPANVGELRRIRAACWSLHTAVQEARLTLAALVASEVVDEEPGEADRGDGADDRAEDERRGD